MRIRSEIIRLKGLKRALQPMHVCKQTAQTSTDGSTALCARGINFQTTSQWLASFSQECDSHIISTFWAPKPFGHRQAGVKGGVGTRAESALFQPWDPGINPLPRYNPIQLGAAPGLAKQRTQRGVQHVSHGRHRHVHTPPRNKRQRGRCHLWLCTPTHQPSFPP